MSGGCAGSESGSSGDAAYVPEVIPLSLCDYPGEPALVIFFSGCNYRCGYCQNWKIRVREPSHLASLRRVEEILEGGRLISACKVTGGEPLLQLDPLLRIARKAKSLGYKFGIDTNGTLPDRLSALLPFLDLISIDVKTALEDAEYRRVSGVEDPMVGKVIESIKMALSSSAFVDLRMVVIPGLNDSFEIIRRIESRLKELGYSEKASKGGASFTLVEFVPENAASREYSERRNPSVEDLVRLARSMSLCNVRISHRALGHYVRVDSIKSTH